MFEIVGFAHINKDATTCKGAINPQEFIGKICAVMEFYADGGVLVFNPQKTALAMFDKEDIYRSFKCGIFGDVVTPPDCNSLERMGYAAAAKTRKGGYNNLIRNIVIEVSLMKGKFHDSFLWEKQ